MRLVRRCRLSGVRSQRRGSVVVARQWPLAWGDTSTPWDWGYRVLTLSDHASEWLGDERFAALWQQERLFFRTHAVRFAEQRVSAVKHVDVAARVVRVGVSSFRFECDLSTTENPVATTQGTFVYVNDAGTASQALPPQVATALQQRVEPEQFLRDLPPPPPRPEQLEDVRCWDSVARDSDATFPQRVVRESDCDRLGHVNNAKYVHYVFDVLRAQSIFTMVPKLLSLEYLAPAHPGDLLTARFAMSGDEVARIDILRRATSHNNSEAEPPTLCVSATVVF